MSRILICLQLFIPACLLHCRAEAQLLPDSSGDSILYESRREEVFEQNIETEDSPLLEYYEDKRTTGKTRIEMRSRLIRRLQTPAGFSDGTYAGSMVKSYQRIKMGGDSFITGGLLLEKDPGERKLNDFMAGNLVFRNLKILKSIVIGDFVVESGQGLCYWRSYEVSKNIDVSSAVRKTDGSLKPYLSSAENGFFRGIAAEISAGKFEPVFFYSSVRRHGSTDSAGRITGFYDMGYFRTSNEMNKRNAYLENTYGFQCDYRLPRGNSIGISICRSVFSRTMYLNDGGLFDGTQLNAVSFNYLLQAGNINLSGEWCTINRKIAGISSLAVAPSKSIALILSYRIYPYKFLTIHGNPFGEFGSNETGFYLGSFIRINRFLTAAIYFDQFKQVRPGSMPSGGNDLLGQVDIVPASKLHITLRYKRKLNEVGDAALNRYGLVDAFTNFKYTHSYRCNVGYSLPFSVKIRSMYEHRRIGYPDVQDGWVFYQDILFDMSDHLSLNIRAAFFDSDSYYSGTAVSERDLTGVLSQPVLYGKGYRWYIIANYHPYDKLAVSLKYSIVVRDDVKNIGNGSDMLPANYDDRVGIQVDVVL